jgi:hypothetical protein
MVHRPPTGERQAMPPVADADFIAKGMFGNGESVYPHDPQPQSLQRLIEYPEQGSS